MLYVIAYKRMATAMQHPNPVGQRIRALRDAMELSLRDLAQRSGVSAPMLSQVERGETSPTLATAEATQIHIGPRVRALREAMGLSLRDLGERSGVSAPMLSQVERGETSPTLAVAERSAKGLELRLSQLLRLDEGGQVAIVRAGDRRPGNSDAASGHSAEILTPPLPGQRAELSRHVLAAHASTGGPGDPPMHEPGSRETALVQSGRVVLRIDGERHELAEGDCVTFDADLPHHFENPGDDDAILLAVVSAGLRRS